MKYLITISLILALAFDALSQDYRQPILGLFVVQNSTRMDSPYLVEVLVDPEDSLSILINDSSYSDGGFYFSRFLSPQLTFSYTSRHSGFYSNDTLYLKIVEGGIGPGGEWENVYEYFGVRIVTSVNESYLNSDSVMKIFDLTGKEIPELREGINIVVYDSGRRERVYKE
jgi:hypothetical protein